MAASNLLYSCPVLRGNRVFLKLLPAKSLCMMADFQNALISRIFSVFSSGFLHRTTVNDL